MPTEEFYASQRDKRILLMYGAASATWMFFLLTGLVGMARECWSTNSTLGACLSQVYRLQIIQRSCHGIIKIYGEFLYAIQKLV